MTLWSNVDNEAGKPKYLSDSLVNDQTVSDLDSTVGVDAAEVANVPSAQHSGWVKITEGSGGRAGRVFSETLVAMGSLTGDIAPEITISGQPTDQSVTAPAAATFTVTATKTGAGTLTYQWRVQRGGVGAWANVTFGTGATTNTFSTGSTATSGGAGATDGDKFRCVVSLTGATSVTSNAVTLTVA